MEAITRSNSFLKPSSSISAVHQEHSMTSTGRDSFFTASLNLLSIPDEMSSEVTFAPSLASGRDRVPGPHPISRTLEPSGLKPASSRNSRISSVFFFRLPLSILLA